MVMEKTIYTERVRLRKILYDRVRLGATKGYMGKELLECN